MTKSIKKLVSQAENQNFDRKSFLIDPKNLAMTIVAFSEEVKNSKKEGGQTGGRRGGQTAINNSMEAVLKAIKENPAVTRIKLSEITGIAPSAVQKHINKLKKQKIIARRGGDFGGHWEILRKE